MYARATSGDKLSNNKFSSCSIRNISRVLEKKRGDCFVGMYVCVCVCLAGMCILGVCACLSCQVHERWCVVFVRIVWVTLLLCSACIESGQPICGNGLVEEGEQCDCGYNDQCKDKCCYDANQDQDKKCKLKPGSICRCVASTIISFDIFLFYLNLNA